MYPGGAKEGRWNKGESKAECCHRLGLKARDGQLDRENGLVTTLKRVPPFDNRVTCLRADSTVLHRVGEMAQVNCAVQ